MAEVTHLDTTNFGSEVSGHAQQGILGDTDVAGTLEPQILAPTLMPRSMAPSSDLGAMDLGTDLTV